MELRRILKGTLITACVLFLGFQILKLEFEAAGARVLLVFLLTVLYCVRVKTKRLFFLLFLICFTLAESLNFISWMTTLDTSIDFFYYGVNLLYMISYVFLVLRILKDMNIAQILSKFWIYFIILIILDIFSVIIVTGTTEKLLSKPEYVLEFSYNSVIMILVTVAMINYMSKNTHKSMNLLLGAIFIFFSEVIQLTYFYISDINILNVMCSLFLVLAFLFLYLQARMPVEPEQNSLKHDQTL